MHVIANFHQNNKTGSTKIAGDYWFVLDGVQADQDYLKILFDLQAYIFTPAMLPLLQSNTMGASRHAADGGQRPGTALHSLGEDCCASQHVPLLGFLLQGVSRVMGLVCNVLLSGINVVVFCVVLEACECQ